MLMNVKAETNRAGPWIRRPSTFASSHQLWSTCSGRCIMTWTDFGGRYVPGDGLRNDCRNIGLLTIQMHDAAAISKIAHWIVW